jgi:hypothetical protein
MVLRVQDGSRIQEHIALRLFIFFEPYSSTCILSGTGAHGECATFDVWVEAFGTELLFVFVFLKKCEYPMVLSDLEIPPDLKIHVLNF